MSIISVSTALWFVGSALSIVPIGLLLINAGAFMPARVCFAVSALFLDLAVLGFLGGTGWPYVCTVPLVISGVAVSGILLMGAFALVRRQEPNLSAKVLGVFGFESQRTTALAIELEITNDGAPSTAHDFRAALATRRGGERILGTNIPIDGSFVVKGLPEGFGGPHEFPATRWLEKTVGERPVARHSTALPCFFVVRFDQYPLLAPGTDDEEGCLEVSFRDAWGRACSPCVYQFNEKKNQVIGFGQLERA